MVAARITSRGVGALVGPQVLKYTWCAVKFTDSPDLHVVNLDSEYDWLSPWRFYWSGSISNGAIWVRTSPPKKRNVRRKATHDRIKSDRVRRAWSAPSRAHGVRIAVRSCSRDSTPRANARAARLTCTP